MVIRAEPLIAPFLTATAGRHALVAAARAVVRGGGERGGTGAGGDSWGLRRGRGVCLDLVRVPSRRPTSQTAGGGWSLPTLPRASSASSLSCRPLTTLVSDLVSALAMSRSFCARAATPEMRAISTLPVSTSHSRAKTLLRR